MKLLIPVIALLLLALIYNSCSPQAPAPPTVSKLDIKRYAGVWHEIARLPNSFEKNLVAAKATYGINPDGTLSVRNDGLKEGGETTSIVGTAKPAGDPGKLLVRFDRFPANLFAGDYWILDVNDDYTRALVGSPDRKFLWLLSKNPGDGRRDFNSGISKAASLGYDTGKLYFNPERITN
jgi:apolipoprotein D and lipocalin family protein